MSSIKVSALTAKTTPAGTEELLINDSGVSKKITIANLPDTNTTYSVGDGGLTTNDFTNADHEKLDGIATSANNYSLPVATSTTYGGIKVSLSGTHLTITA
ncbi:MAG: hypothetical protein HOF36_00610 [Candidatus Marinimicrobia bacterium]|jgi:hypothetical protein|nr:hypothetical protein [Candidatus Neomarinimicrobiota bacterium]